jgi:4-diphosphocytidyl-2-C-methyl-D-erythritol kinase
MIREAAPAKVNLFLHVVGRRADGYHLIESLIAFADIGDAIEVEPAAALSLVVDGPFADRLPVADDNLALRAARRLAREVGREPQARLRLVKTLPIGAGLGGGSADAAATLRALARLWSIADPAPLLRRIAGTLGADVPVCLDGRASFVRGIGEIVEPLRWDEPMPAVLVHPGQGLMTKDVFAARRGAFATSCMGPGSMIADLWTLIGRARNDLQEAAISLCPEIVQVIDFMKEKPGIRVARMSGSGSAYVALCDDFEVAQAIAEDVRRHHPTWWAAATMLGSSAATRPSAKP